MTQQASRRSSELHQVGGSLQSDDPTYVVRQADEALYSLLKQGEFCYVLNSRQMGKSSLRVRVMKRLQAHATCASLDITTFGGNEEKPDRWYAVLIRNLVSELELDNEIELGAWLRERSYLTPVQRLKEFIETVVLEKRSQNIVIFVDEIDKIISLPFSTDDFFAFIRSCYNLRADRPEYNRLTFALLGVANPSDLVKDKTVTPFNIGKSIQLRGFQFEEAHPLKQALEHNADNASAVLKAVLGWTGGQPFLTQKICQLIDDRPGIIKAGTEQASVDQVVTSRILDKWESQDVPVHLKTIRDRLLRSERRASRLLGLYQKILEEQSVAIDGSYDQVELRLSGLVTEQDGQLVPYNKTYSAVFNSDWVANELAKLRPYSSELLAWVESDCEDESRLLRGQALTDALVWASDKSLADRDRLFLSASQGAQLNLERGSKQIVETALEETQRRLAAENRKARRWTRTSLLVFLTLFFSLPIFIATVMGIRHRQIVADRKDDLESDGAELLQTFEDTHPKANRGSEIELLVQAMVLGQERQALVAERGIQGLPPASPRLALQTILDTIRQSNQIEGSSGPVNDFQLDDGTQVLVAVGAKGEANIWNLAENRHIPLEGHSRNIQRVILSPDREQIATASIDGSVRLWTSDGSQLAEFYGSAGQPMVDAAFSPDGRQLAIAGGGGVASLWNLEGELIANLEGHEGRINRVLFSPDGNSLFTAGDDGTIRIWNADGTQLQVLRGHAGWVNDLQVSPDGQWLATGGVDGTARLWDATNGIQMAEYTGHNRWVRSVRFSPNGQQLVTAGDDGIARLWDLEGNLLAELGSGRDLKRINDIQFSDDGRHVVTASDDGNAYLWTLEGRILARFSGHRGRVLNARFTSGDRKVVTTGEDGTIRFWAIRENLPSDTFNHEEWLSNVRFHPDGRRLATAGVDGAVRLWTLDGGLLATLNGHEGWINDVQFSPGGWRLATAGDNGIAYLWDMKGTRLSEFSGHEGWINDVQFSPNQNTLATAGVDGTARLWNLPGKQLAEFRGHDGWVNRVEFSPNGRLIATAGMDGTIRLWDLDGSQRMVLEGHTASVNDVQFSGDGTLLASAGQDGTARLWGTDGQALGVMEEHEGWVRSVQFNPGGDMIVSTGQDGTAIVWSLEIEKLAELTGHDGWLVDARFNPEDGQQLVTAGVDGTVRLWDLEGNQLAKFLGHEGWINDIQFSPNGEQLIAAQDDGTANLLNVDSMGQLLDRGCEWLENYLVHHPKDLAQLTSCHDNSLLLSRAAPSLVDSALQVASEDGDLEGSTAYLELALEWNPLVDLDPETNVLESDPAAVAEQYFAQFEEE